jgi:hypothetical protein
MALIDEELKMASHGSFLTWPNISYGAWSEQMIGVSSSQRLLIAGRLSAAESARQVLDTLDTGPLK